jgi:hypothetical protein
MWREVRATKAALTPEAAMPMLAWCSSAVKRSVAGSLEPAHMRVASSEGGGAESLEYLSKHLGGDLRSTPP